ncbi:hypothetical protein DOY81_005363, partial [Sarcophaga bullata]
IFYYKVDQISVINMWAFGNFILILSFIGIALAGRNESWENSKESIEMETIDNDCMPGCPRIFDPICAVDEKHPKEYKYFHNQCLMEYESCSQSLAWKPTQMLLCIKDIDPVLRNGCMRACPMIYNPVCATDGKNYEIFGNQCSFGMENCLASGKWLEVLAEQCGL